jgi:hypothetical protein
MRTITAKDLDDKLEQKADLHLINIVTTPSDTRDHIPGSINVPDISFLLQQFGKEEEMVLYSADDDHTAVEQAYRRLEEEGYTSLWLFPEGMKQWGDSH